MLRALPILETGLLTKRQSNQPDQSNSSEQELHSHKCRHVHSLLGLDLRQDHHTLRNPSQPAPDEPFRSREHRRCSFLEDYRLGTRGPSKEMTSKLGSEDAHGHRKLLTTIGLLLLCKSRI